MKSPSGWALASMWYDKYPGVPPRGSPLETVFLLVHLQRQEVALMAQRTQVRGQLALLAKSPESAKAALEAYENYCDALFPFLNKATESLGEDKKRLLEHVKYPLRIDIGALQHEMGAKAKAKGLAKFRLKEKK